LESQTCTGVRFTTYATEMGEVFFILVTLHGVKIDQKIIDNCKKYNISLYQIEAYYDPNNGGNISFGERIVHFQAENSEDEDCAGYVDDTGFPVDTRWKSQDQTNEESIPEEKSNIDCEGGYN
jgi:hypothetical protein